MTNFYLTRLVRTEHARQIRRQRGWNDFRDKQWMFTKVNWVAALCQGMTDDNMVGVIWN